MGSKSPTPQVIAGKYEVLETIGRGGMGTVYKAVQRNLDRVVAVKMLSEDLASDPEFRARFQQEATVVARLSHPNIVAVYDIETHNHTFCIIMEYLEGENLQAKIDRDVTLPERDVVLIGAQVSRALGYAHSQGIIHRDIKPDNIHVTPAGVAKVMDFGIARFLDSKLKTQTGISMGTPKFMSPEQVTGKNVDGQTDLYSLGVCLYYCLAGRPPFDGENAIAVATRHLYEQPEPPSRFNQSITPAVEKVVMRALEKQKAERYATGFDLADALEGTLGIKTPIRIAEEGAAEIYAGATQRMSVQQVGGAAAEMYLEDEPGNSDPSMEAATAGTPQRLRRSGWANITPVKVRSMSGLDDFKSPNLTPTSRTSTTAAQAIQATRRWWPAIAAFALFCVGGAYLAFHGGADKLPIQTDPASSAPRSVQEEYFQVLRNAQEQSRSGRPAEAIDLLQSFSKRHPNFKTEEIQDQMHVYQSQLPVTSDELIQRRVRLGNRFAAENPAVATAYLRTVTPEQSRFAANRLPTLVSMVDRPLKLSEVEKVTAENAFSRAQKQRDGGAGGSSKEAEDAYLNAIKINHENARYWIGLGDFYRSQGRIDDARVMYGEGLRRGEGEERGEAQRKLNELNT